MREQKVLFVLAMAFLLALVSCGGKGADAYENLDEYSLEDDSSSSNKNSSDSGKDNSSSSRTGSSSSEKADFSEYSSCSSSDLLQSSSSGNSSSNSSSGSSEKSSESSSSSQEGSSSSVDYEDLPGKVIEGEYQGTTRSGENAYIEVRALTDKLEYVDSAVSYRGKMDATNYKFNVRGLPEDIRYAEIYIRLNNGSLYGTNDVKQYAIVDLKNVDSLYVNSAMSLISKRIMYLASKKGLSFAEAKAQAEDDLQKVFQAEAPLHDLEKINLFVDGSVTGLWAAAISTLESMISWGKSIHNLFWADSFVTEGKLKWDEAFITSMELNIYRCDGTCFGDVYPRCKNKDLIKEIIIKIFDLASGRGTCTADREGEVFKYDLESYSYDYHFTCSESFWRKSTDFEADMHGLGFPVCRTTEKIVMAESKREYYCDGNESWIAASYWTTEVPLAFRFNEDIVYGKMTDPRDGQTYRTVMIGDKEWMAQNLNFTGYAKAADEDSALVANLSDGSVCYENEEKNCNLCGRLYNWAATMNINESTDSATARAMIAEPYQGICPEGWHLPNENEFKHMISDYYNKATDKTGELLKSRRGWGLEKTDPLGFAALPCGRYYYANDGKGYSVSIGSETHFSVISQYYLRTDLRILSSKVGMEFYNGDKRGEFLSVRCVKND